MGAMTAIPRVDGLFAVPCVTYEHAQQV